MPVLTDQRKIGLIAAEKELENEAFREFLKPLDGEQLDRMVQTLNEEITPEIDCTRCGNCCKSLVHVTTEESLTLATHLQVSLPSFKEKYLEVSEQGQMVISSIPCHFLKGTTCSIYEHRFAGCREFPHLHKPNFKGRLFGILMFYPSCPIIFNVVENLKKGLGFKALLPQ